MYPSACTAEGPCILQYLENILNVFKYYCSYKAHWIVFAKKKKLLISKIYLSLVSKLLLLEKHFGVNVKVC